MPGKLNVYTFGAGGVNLTKSPLELNDDEAVQLQNAELVPDLNTGGQAALTKRGGLAVLNSSALAGSVLGIIGLPLLTTYTRVLYFARGSQNANTWATTTDGVTFTAVATPLAHAIQTDWTDESGARDAHRMASYKTYLAYPGNNYTKSTDAPEITFFDGTNNQLVERIPTGPSSTGVAFDIADMLVANGKIYLAVHDQGGTGANMEGRVMAYDLITGELQQVLNAFGTDTGNVTGGYPAALAWYQQQLWVGLNSNTTTDAIGKIVRAYPDVDATWTTDVSNLSGQISSLMAFQGSLYVGTRSSVSTAAKIYKRSATAGTYAAQFTSTPAGQTAFCGNLLESNSIFYATEYSAGGDSDAAILKIKKSSDGTTWTDDRNVASTDSGISGNVPTNAVAYGSDMYIIWRATTAGGTNAIINRLTGGTWSKATTGNYNGNAAVLVTRA
jgi:hypothetical protein